MRLPLLQEQLRCVVREFAPSGGRPPGARPPPAAPVPPCGRRPPRAGSAGRRRSPAGARPGRAGCRAGRGGGGPGARAGGGTPAGRPCRGRGDGPAPRPPRPSSVRRPAYMTSTRSAWPATTSMSWVTRTSAAPDRLPLLGEQPQHLVAALLVEGGGGFVGDHEVGLVDRRHGDHRALPHAAGVLVRIRPRLACGVRDADPVERRDRAGPGLLAGDAGHRPYGGGELVAHRVHRGEGGQGVLRDEGDRGGRGGPTGPGSIAPLVDRAPAAACRAAPGP